MAESAWRRFFIFSLIRRLESHGICMGHDLSDTRNYKAFVDNPDGYSYYYPADWREFDFRGHDSAFRDRFLQLQNVWVRFTPTDAKYIHDLGPIDEVVYNLMNHVYAAPSQMVNILDVQEKCEMYLTIGKYAPEYPDGYMMVQARSSSDDPSA